MFEFTTSEKKSNEIVKAPFEIKLKKNFIAKDGLTFKARGHPDNVTVDDGHSVQNTGLFNIDNKKILVAKDGTDIKVGDQKIMIVDDKRIIKFVNESRFKYYRKRPSKGYHTPTKSSNGFIVKYWYNKINYSKSFKTIKYDYPEE